jgi:dienelactone hydrolase
MALLFSPGKSGLDFKGMRLLRILTPLMLALSFVTCQKPAGPPCSIGEISDYFVNPSETKLALLASRPADTAALNATFRTLRAPAVAGMHQDWMTDTAGQPYSLGYATPAAIAPDTTYPLIIYLHGGIGSPRNDKGDSAYLMLASLADTFQLFLASPSANRFTPWWSPSGLARILQTLRFMALRYPVNPRKVFLAGVSDGATGCFAAANTIPAPFAGFIAVSGFGGMLPQLGMSLIAGNLRQRPIYNVNAGLDHIYPIDAVKEFIRSLQDQGVPVTFKEYPDEKHGFDYREKEMGMLAGLIRTWSRPESAVLSWTFIPGYPNLPDNILDYSLSSDNGAINSFWRGDTLMIQSQGVSAVSAVFSMLPPATKISCRLMGDKERKRTISPVNLDWPQSLRLMQERCFPGFGKATIYTIKL